jgi:hypothetical protein
MSECRRCTDLEWTIDQLRDEIVRLEKEVRSERDLKEKAEWRERELKPYKERADRAYDRCVSTPKGMP